MFLFKGQPTECSTRPGLHFFSSIVHSWKERGQRIVSDRRCLDGSSEQTPDCERVPHLLQADGVGLWFAVFSQVELLVELFGQVSMTAFSKHCDFSVEFHSSLKNILVQETGGRFFFFNLTENILHSKIQSKQVYMRCKSCFAISIVSFCNKTFMSILCT